MSRAFPSYAILLAIDAHEPASALADVLGSTVATSQHPKAGPRIVPDELLRDVVGQAFRPKGAMPSPWIGSSEFAALRDLFTDGGYDAECHACGLAVELPFFEDEPCRLEARTDMADTTAWQRARYTDGVSTV